MLVDSPSIPNYSRKVARLKVASLALRWYLHFLVALELLQYLVDSFFAYFFITIPNAKYSDVESIPAFLLLNCFARFVPRPCLDWERVTGHKMLPIIPALCSVLMHCFSALLYEGFPVLPRAKVSVGD